MIVYFAMPDEGAKEINGFLGVQYRRMKITELTKETFRHGFERFKAVLVVPDKSAACEALNVPLDEPGIIEGLTPADYARKVGRSRQVINQQMKKGILDYHKIGKLLVITHKTEEVQSVSNPR